MTTSSRTETVVKSLGWFGLGLGAAQLVAPEAMARLIGLRPTRATKRTMRLFGAREALTGIGLLTRRGQPRWLLARLAGDAIDAALLGRSLTRRGPVFLGRQLGRRRAAGTSRVGTALAGVAAVTALDFLAHRLTSQQKAEVKELPAMPPVLRAAVTIARPAAELYAFWRDVENLSVFVSRVDSIKATDRTRSHWEMKGPLGKQLAWNAVIVEDQPGERIGWQIERGAFARLIDSGDVQFRPAPGGRGTEVHVTLRATNLASGKLLSTWLRQLPERWLTHELQRFKQYMELGEIPQSDASVHEGRHAARPSEANGGGAS